MKKILVATDLSKYSAVGIRFAIQLAQQNKYKLTFFYTYAIAKPVSWSAAVFETYRNKEKIKNMEMLARLVESVYKNMGSVNKKIELAVCESSNTGEEILKQADKNKFDFICVGTHGAGVLTKIFGTHTSWLINHSNIPILAVPQNYRASKIKKILYASDLKHLSAELKKVVGFSKLLKADLELIHFDSPAANTDSKRIDKRDLKIILKHGVNLRLVNNSGNGFIDNIKNAIVHSKPSVLILFTHRNRSLVSKTMHPSLSAEYSFAASIPMIIFNN